MTDLSTAPAVYGDSRNTLLLKLATAVQGGLQNVFYASDFMALDSNIDSGGGTDITSVLNSTMISLAAAYAHPVLILGYPNGSGGCGLVSGTVKQPENLHFWGVSSETSGLFMRANSYCQMWQNLHLHGLTMTVGGGSHKRMTLNSNEANQKDGVTITKRELNDPNNGYVQGHWVGGVNGFTVEDIVMRNSPSFAFPISNTIDVWHRRIKAIWDRALEDETGTQNWDGYHEYGNNTGGGVNGHWSNGDDDMHGCNTREGAYNFKYFTDHGRFGPERFPPMNGDIVGRSYSNYWSQNARSLIRLNTIGTALEYGTDLIDNCIWTNIRGRCPGWSLWNSDAKPTLGTITVNGWVVGGGPASNTPYKSNIDLLVPGPTSLTLSDIASQTLVDAHATAMVGNYFTLGVTPQRVTQYKLADTTDSVGQWNLTNVGGATFGTGKIGNCVNLNGTSQYLTSHVDATGISFSLCGWFNFAASANVYVLASQAGPAAASADNRFSLYKDTDNTIGAYLAASSGDITVATSVATASTWTFVQLTWDNATFALRLRLNNGAWATVSASGAMLTTGTTSLFTLGAILNAALGAPQLYFAGMLDAWEFFYGVNSDANFNDRYRLGVGTED